MDFLTILEARSLNPTCQQGHALGKGIICSFASFSFWWGVASLTCGHIAPFPAFSVILPLFHRDRRESRDWCWKVSVLVHFGFYNKVPYIGCLLNNRNVYLLVLEAGNSRIKVPAESVSVDSPLPGAYTAILLCSHLVEGASFTRALILNS